MDPFVFDRTNARGSQNQPQKQNEEPEKPRDPSIHTMESDTKELFARGRQSVAQMIGKAREEPAARTNRRHATAYLTFGLVMIAFFVLGGILWSTRGYWLWLVTPRTPDTPQTLQLPPPFFATEATRTISTRRDDQSAFLLFMEDALSETEREGVMKRIIIILRDAGGERYANFEDIMRFYAINAPGPLLDRLDDSFMAYAYYGTDGSRLGLAAGVKDVTRALRDLFDWERSMAQDTAPLFIGTFVPPRGESFQDRAYRNIDWRYLPFSEESDLGLGYAMFSAHRVFVITTSADMMERTIDRILGPR